MKTFPKMSKRVFIACSVMSLPFSAINPKLMDEDMIEDIEGLYFKSSEGYYPMGDYKGGYSIKPESSYEKRLVRSI